MKRVLICAAVPRELKLIRRNLSTAKGKKRSSRDDFSALTTPVEVTLLRTGIGALNAESSIISLLRELHPDLIISLGFGGALHEGLAAGDLIWASRVYFLRNKASGKETPEISDISLSESKIIADRLAGSISIHEGCIVTLEHLMPKLEIRKRLPEGISFPVCDMETFVLARTAITSRIPFFAARAISDTASQEIPPELLDVNKISGDVAYFRLLKSVLRKPGLAKDIVRLGINSEKAARSLGDLIKFLPYAAV